MSPRRLQARVAGETKPEIIRFCGGLARIDEIPRSSPEQWAHARPAQALLLLNMPAIHADEHSAGMIQTIRRRRTKG